MSNVFNFRNSKEEPDMEYLITLLSVAYQHAEAAIELNHYWSSVQQTFTELSRYQWPMNISKQLKLLKRQAAAQDQNIGLCLSTKSPLLATSQSVR